MSAHGSVGAPSTPRPRRMPGTSLRRRVTVGFAVFIIVVISALAAIVLRLVDAQEELLINHLISQEMQYFVDQYRINPDVQPPRTQNLYGYAAPVADIRTRIPELLRDLQPGTHEVYLGEAEFHVLVRDVGTARLYLTYDVSEHEQRLDHLLLQLIAAVSVVALLSAAVSHFLTGLLMRPLTALAGRVGSLQPSNGDSRLADEYHDVEVVRLAQAFDDYRRQVHALIRSEQDFTSDVSHELRTPLTSIRTSCELLAQDEGLSARSRARIANMIAAVDRMVELVESLLFLARHGFTDQGEPLSLAAAVHGAVESLQELARDRDVRVSVDIGEDLDLRAGKSALHMVLSNLIRNAITHAPRGRVTVRYARGGLDVIDTGEGIDPADMPNLFRRFYRGAGVDTGEGFGLGLAIVKRICDHYGWDISVRSRPAEGAVFTVRFLPAAG